MSESNQDNEQNNEENEEATDLVSQEEPSLNRPEIDEVNIDDIESILEHLHIEDDISEDVLTRRMLSLVIRGQTSNTGGMPDPLTMKLYKTWISEEFPDWFKQRSSLEQKHRHEQDKIQASIDQDTAKLEHTKEDHRHSEVMTSKDHDFKLRLMTIIVGAGLSTLSFGVAALSIWKEFPIYMAVGAGTVGVAFGTGSAVAAFLKRDKKDPKQSSASSQSSPPADPTPP